MQFTIIMKLNDLFRSSNSQRQKDDQLNAKELRLASAPLVRLTSSLTCEGAGQAPFDRQPP